MKTYLFNGALSESGWICPAYITIDGKGFITSFATTPKSNENIEVVEGYALPGLVNGHSHAFQYAMAGLGEMSVRAKGRDDFWSWRNSMYQLALSIGPDAMEAIASQLYHDLLLNGYTHVVEFHYLHKDKNGSAYDNPSEMSERLISAAQRVGIGITLIPILYQQGGFGKPGSTDQRRFLSTTLDEYTTIFEGVLQLSKSYSDVYPALGAHSLRAVGTEGLKELIDIKPTGIPFHMHISEQLREVEECQAYLGSRPVEWALDHLNLGPNTYMVHATHMNVDEANRLASSGAAVVLCPSTEGNLGDGIFPMAAFLERSGRWCIGTDSHIGLHPFEELRILDYGLRTHSRTRVPFQDDNSLKPVESSFYKMVKCGRGSAGLDDKSSISIGSRLDALVISSDTARIWPSNDESRLSTILYTMGTRDMIGTIVAGQWKVKDGRHEKSASILSAYKTAITRLHE